MNLQGGNVGTSLIAEHGSISPGNLYYHFRNREEILREIFRRLETDLGRVLHIEDGESVDARRLAGFYTAGAHVLWQYRFLFASATEIIFRDPWLADEYEAFSRRSIDQISRILTDATRMHPGPLPASAADCVELAENKWVLWTGWPRHAEMRLRGRAVTEADFARGLEQIFGLLTPYLEAGYRRETARAIHHVVQTLDIDFPATA
jgi:AcrR family transcriptional regulator